jgi:hypothetical protein
MRGVCMNISGAMGKTGAVPGTAAPGRRPAKERTDGSAAGGSDHLQLSELGEHLSLGVSLLHAAKLSGLTQVVSAGGYGPEPILVSASIIDHSLGGKA